MTLRSSCQRPRRGITLVDLVISLLIMGIIVAGAAPRFSGMLQQYRIQSATDRIVADLALARKHALATSKSVIIRFSVAGDMYNIGGMAHLDSPGSPYLVELAGPPYEARLIATSLGGDAELVFDQFGRPDGGGTVTVQAGDLQQTVSIDPDTGEGSTP